jgi:hypothetical protein
LSAKGWQEREKFLVEAYESVARMHNSLEITELLAAKADYFFGRPFQVIHLHGDFAGTISRKITDPEIKRLIERKLIGSVGQFSDSTDILSDAKWRPVLRKLYE